MSGDALRTGLAFALCAALLASGCTSSADQPGEPTTAPEPTARLALDPLPRSQTASCDEAMIGGGREPWRRLSTASGPFGFFGIGRGFATDIVDVDLSRGDAVKVPAVVAGDRRVIVSIAPRDRDRAKLDYGFSGPTRRIAFEPCARKRVTSWPGGLEVSGQDRPVAVRIEVEGESEARRLEVGRITARELAALRY